MDLSASGRVNFFPALFFSAAVFAPVALAARRITGAELGPAYPFLWALFAAQIAFFIFYTGRVSFHRRIFFSGLAVLFLIRFKLCLLPGLSGAACPGGEPYCHIAIAPSFFNYLYQQYLALMSGAWRLWGPLSLAFLWLFFTLVIGRAWCSWACFGGGIDDGLCALPKKPVLGAGVFAAKFRDFPAALLIFLLLVSLAQMLPVYCLWLCPFKLTDSFMDTGDAFVRKAQLGLMFLALAALILGPLLTKKRLFCSFLCPFAAWQSFWGRVNPFRVGVDVKTCSACGACSAACPVFAIKPGAEGKAEISAYCNLCGECLAACPSGSLRYSAFGAVARSGGAGFRKLLDTETFFVFSALVVGGAFGSLFAPAALRDLVFLLKKVTLTF